VDGDLRKKNLRKAYCGDSIRHLAQLCTAFLSTLSENGWWVSLKAACTSPVGVILSAAAFQVERRISRLTGPARKPSCTTTEIQNLRKFKTLGNPT
jgi:hypothetical protein